MRFANAFGVKIIVICLSPGLAANPGLEFANAFGVGMLALS